MSLFDAPKDSILVHACNAQGVWESGIAKEFKEKYPQSYIEYEDFCNGYIKTGISGLSMWDKNESHWIGWLITSEYYGKLKDNKETIKINTVLALDDFCRKVRCAERDIDISEVYSNKFNSGLFNVPWEDTERILKVILKKYRKIKWIVCDPNLDE